MAEGQSESNERNIWQDLLEESMANNTWETNKQVPSYLVVLGDKANGKSSLLEKFRNHSSNGTESGYILDYSYIAVKNKHGMDSDQMVSRLNVWQLDDPHHMGLLENVVPSSSLGVSAFAITIDMSRPGEILDQLNSWLAPLEEFSGKALASLSEEEQAALKLRVSSKVQGFTDVTQKLSAPVPAEPAAEPAAETATETTEGGEAETGGEEAKAAEGELDLADNNIKVDPAIPAKNLGAPLFIVGTKTDFFSRDPRISKAANADERFEFVVAKLRQAALAYGATLILTSAAGEGTNIEVLQDCIFNQVFDFPLTTKAKVVGGADDFSIVVPSGYDSDELINSGRKFDASMNCATMFPEFSNVSKENQGSGSVVAMDNEDFFNSIHSQLKGGKPIAPKATVTATTGEKKKKDVKGFFNNLLKKK